MIQTYCPHCGLVFRSRAFGWAKNVNIRSLTLEGNRETCISCGNWAHIQSGHFSVVDGIVRNLSIDGVTRTDLLHFQEVVQGYQSGLISRSEAETRVVNLGSNFAEVWGWIGDNDKQLLVVLTIVTILLSTFFNILTLAEARKLSPIEVSQHVQERLEALEREKDSGQIEQDLERSRDKEGGDGDIV